MYKLLTVSLIAALTSANIAYVSDANAAWPALNQYYSFSAATELYQWDGSKLVSTKGVTGTAKVDAGRNKVKIDGKATISGLGSIDGQVLLDFTAGTALEYVKALGICQKKPLNFTLSLKTVLSQLYSESAGLTKYIGQSTAPWDATKMHKFTSTYKQGTETLISDSYWDQSTKSPKWFYSTHTGVVSKLTNQVEATFKDSDFVISGCNEVSAENSEISMFF